MGSLSEAPSARSIADKGGEVSPQVTPSRGGWCSMGGRAGGRRSARTAHGSRSRTRPLETSTSRRRFSGLCGRRAPRRRDHRSGSNRVKAPAAFMHLLFKCAAARATVRRFEHLKRRPRQTPPFKTQRGSRTRKLQPGELRRPPARRVPEPCSPAHADPATVGMDPKPSAPSNGLPSRRRYGFLLPCEGAERRTRAAARNVRNGGANSSIG